MIKSFTEIYPNNLTSPLTRTVVCFPSEFELPGFSSTILFCLQNKLPSWQLKEDGEYASSRTFDFHKFAENFKARSSDKRWSSDSNGLEQDFTSAKSTGQSSLSCDSDNENDEDDEIFLVFRGKPNSRLSSFDECQAAAGKRNPLLNPAGAYLFQVRLKGWLFEIGLI